MAKIRTILIVDDSHIDHITCKYTIEDYDASINVLAAYDGQEALDLLRTSNKPIDLILLDINMPGMNGHEFLKEYAKYGETSSVVVMLTSSDQKEDKEKCAAYDFVKAYFSKPLEETSLSELSKFLDD